MIKITELDFQYGRKPVLNKLNLKLVEGKHLRITGPKRSRKNHSSEINQRRTVPQMGRYPGSGLHSFGTESGFFI